MTKQKEIYKKALKLAIPMMIQNGITNMVGLIDNVMVGSLGTEAITAVSIIGQLIFIFNLAIFGGISGPGIYGAQFFGQKNMEGLRNTFRIKIWICGICLLFGLTIFTCFGANLIQLYLHGESATMDAALTMSLAQDYLHIMFANTIPFVITQIYASTLRETGESVTPMIAGVASVVVDIVFNYLLIFGKFGLPALGVKGAALATVLARIVEMTIVIVYAHTHKARFAFLQGLYRTILIPKDLCKRILLKGIPIFFNEFLWAGGIAAMTQSYSLCGLEVIAGLNISNALCNLLNVVFIALGNAVGVLSGQTLGEGKFEEAKENAFHLMWFTAGICLVLTAILELLAGAFPLLYDTEPEVRALATNFIRINALFFPVQGYLNALYFTLRSGGKTLITFIFDSVFTWAVPVTIAFTLSSFTSLHILVIFTLVQAADIIKLAIGYVLVKRGVWITNLVAD